MNVYHRATFLKPTRIQSPDSNGREKTQGYTHAHEYIVFKFDCARARAFPGNPKITKSPEGEGRD